TGVQTCALPICNSTRILVSDLGGRTGMALKARELGIELDERAAAELTERLKRLEAEGYQFEAADASLELLMREATGWTQPFFRSPRASAAPARRRRDRKSTRLNSSHVKISYAVFCLKKKKKSH